MAAARRHPCHCREVARRHQSVDLRTARLILAIRLAHALTTRPCILDLHELMSRRVEHLEVIQSEMVELARRAEVGKQLCRQKENSRSVLEAGQMLLGGQQRLDKIVQRIEQLAADLNA